MIATGGTVSIANQSGVKYAVHEFRDVGTSTFTVNSLGSVSTNNQIEYLIIGGGGGGGQNAGAGGGAGGYRSSANIVGELSGGLSPIESKVTVTAQSYPIVVGAGGNGGTTSIVSTFGFDGQPSSAFGITSLGGGAGINSGGANGRPGGSGGGTGNDNTGNRTGGAGTTGQGFKGGDGTVPGGGDRTGGGGGGAGGAGQNSVNTVLAGFGGVGLSSSITGTPIFRAGGGGGGVHVGTDGAGGNGGGGAGGGFSGVDGTGGGGGAGRSPNPGGRGGHGIVIIRYPIGVAS
jgi:hypothetical protein